MFTERLINELGLLKLQAKNSSKQTATLTAPKSDSTKADTEQRTPTKPDMDVVKLDKNEFRLLVKMLQAIKHDCVYDQIHFDGQVVSYEHPKKTLVFNDINLADSDQIMNLSSLKDLINEPALKRPVWEKLKQI